MGAGEGPQLQEERRCKAHRDGRAAPETRSNGDGGAQGVDAAVEGGRADGQEYVEERQSRRAMYFAHLFRLVMGDFGKVGLDSSKKIRVEGGDEIVVVLFLVGSLEDGPRQVVDIPRVLEVDIGESQGNGSLRLGQGRDVKIGPEGNRGGYRCLDR